MVVYILALDDDGDRRDDGQRRAADDGARSSASRRPTSSGSPSATCSASPRSSPPPAGSATGSARSGSSSSRSCVFVAMSMLCGAAQSLEQLIAFRVFQGIGGGMLTPDRRGDALPGVPGRGTGTGRRSACSAWPCWLRRSGRCSAGSSSTRRRGGGSSSSTARSARWRSCCRCAGCARRPSRTPDVSTSPAWCSPRPASRYCSTP